MKFKFSLLTLFIISIFATSCNHTPRLSVYKDDKLLDELDNIPTKDTVLEYGDYFITIRYEEDMIKGSVSSIEESNDNEFKCSDNAKVFLNNDGFKVECTMN